MRIDSHQHFWRPARGDYAWLHADEPALAPLMQDFSPQDLLPLLRSSSVTHTVLVQAADTTAETDYLLELAAQADFVAGVVGWVDISHSDSVGQLEQWAYKPVFKGVRPMLQDLPRADWIAQLPCDEVVQTMVRLGLRLDALVKPEHLPSLLKFVQKWPQLPVVIDHAAKPSLAHGMEGEWFELWQRYMPQLAAMPQVYCKFSGLLTQMNAGQLATPAQSMEALRSVWDRLLQWFGPLRLMWGSDWPVLTLVDTYSDWQNFSRAHIGELSVSEQALVWGGAAQQFYGIQASEIRL